MGKLPKSSRKKKKSTGQLTTDQGTLGGCAFGGYRGWCCDKEESWLAATLSHKVASCGCGSAFDAKTCQIRSKILTSMLRFKDALLLQCVAVFFLPSYCTPVQLCSRDYIVLPLPLHWKHVIPAVSNAAKPASKHQKHDTL